MVDNSPFATNKNNTYTVAQTARELGVSNVTVYQWYHNGSLKGFKNANGNIAIPAEEVQHFKNMRMKSGAMDITKAAAKLNIATSTVKAMLQDGRLTPQVVNGQIKVNAQEVAKLNDIQNDPDYMTIPEIAAYMNVNKGTVYQWVNKGKLKCIAKIGLSYYRKSDVDAIRLGHHTSQTGTVRDYLTTGQVAEILGTSKQTVIYFADYGFLKASRARINGRSIGERMFDKEFLTTFMKFHGITKGNPEKIVLTRSDNQQFRFTTNYTQALENGITPDIHRLTHDGYERLNEYGEVVSSKKGLNTNATKIQKKPTDIKFKAKPEVSINNNDMADLNQATKAYTQVLLDEAKRMIDFNEFVVANRLIQLAEATHDAIEYLTNDSHVQVAKAKTV